MKRVQYRHSRRNPRNGRRAPRYGRSRSRHDLQMGEAQMSRLSRAITCARGQEDIGDFQGSLHAASAVDVCLIADEARDLVERK